MRNHPQRQLAAPLLRAQHRLCVVLRAVVDHDHVESLATERLRAQRRKRRREPPSAITRGDDNRDVRVPDLHAAWERTRALA